MRLTDCDKKQQACCLNMRLPRPQSGQAKAKEIVLAIVPKEGPLHRALSTDFGDVQPEEAERHWESVSPQGLRHSKLCEPLRPSSDISHVAQYL